MDQSMMFKAGRSLFACCAGLLCWANVFAADSVPAPLSPWPDSFVARLEAYALLEALNADLLSHDSATSTLERWCDVHRLASTPHMLADRVMDVDKLPSLEQRRELGVTPSEPVRYRRVRLRCGTVVLSEADNWYVPARLTPEMNRLLETTDVPFGKAVQALHFHRHTLSVALLWHPLPENWEMNRPAKAEEAAWLRLPPHLLEHRAILTLPDGTPFSEVIETYSRNVLAFPFPKP
jgi:chorismate-pyruvate lyase